MVCHTPDVPSCTSADWWLWARSLPPWHPLQDCQLCRRSSRSHGLLVKCQVSRLVAIILDVPGGHYINTLTMETVTDFIFLGFRITADGDCSHEIKRHLFHGRKIMTNLDSILKCRDTTFPTKVCLIKAMVFPEILTGCNIWTIKKAEGWRINAFKSWC